jgi:hypothetical protein
MTISAIRCAQGATTDAYERACAALITAGYQPNGEMIFDGNRYTREFFLGVQSPVALGNVSSLRWVEVTAAASALASAGTVPVAAGATGVQYAVRDVILHGGGTNFASAGDRLLDLTDGTTVYTTVANADLETAPTVSLRLGHVKVPFLTGKSAVLTAEGDDLVLAYSGGTTDHDTGSIKFAVLIEQIAVPAA